MTKDAQAKERARRAHGEEVVRRRRGARLAAIQALYQMELTGIRTEAVLLEFLQHRFEEEFEGFKLGDVDKPLMGEIVRGVERNRTEIDDMLTAVIAEDWQVERLEALLRAILRAGAFELGWRPAVPARTVISEYVELAHDFFGGREPAMVNGMLDRIAHTMRPDEFSDAGPAGK